LNQYDFLLDSTSLNRSMGRAKAQQVWVVVRFWKKKIDNIKGWFRVKLIFLLVQGKN
jgi:hypothetical protein